MMPYTYARIEDKATQAEAFARMEAEGLTRCAMYSLAAPTVADWARIIGDAETRGGLLLGCYAPTGQELVAVGLFAPLYGRTWSFDFTVYRGHFAHAVDMARGGFRWIFATQGASAIVGMTPAANRHAWRLATACGFAVWGSLPQACWLARRGTYDDGVCVVCTPETLHEVM